MEDQFEDFHISDLHISNDNLIETSKLYTCQNCHHIPYIYFKSPNYISIECICQKKELMTISQYLSKVSNRDKAIATCFFDKHPQQEKAISFCVQCQKWMCKACLDLHNAYIKDHQLLSQSIELQQKCNEHDKEMITTYCIQCQKEICNLCLSSHKGHNMFNYKELNYDDLIRTQNYKFAEIKNKVFEKNKAIKESIVKRLKEYISMIEKSFEEYESKNKEICKFVDLEFENFVLNNKIKNYQLIDNFKRNTSVNINDINWNNQISDNEIKRILNYFHNEIMLEVKNKQENIIKVPQVITTVCSLMDKRLAVGNSEGMIYILKPPSYEIDIEMKAHELYVNDIIQLNNGLLVSCSEEGTLKVWTIFNENCYHIEATFEFNSSVNALLNSSNDFFASCSSNGEVTLRNQFSPFDVIVRLQGRGKKIKYIKELRNGLIVRISEVVKENISRFSLLGNEETTFSIDFWNFEISECCGEVFFNGELSINHPTIIEVNDLVYVGGINVIVVIDYLSRTKNIPIHTVNEIRGNFGIFNSLLKYNNNNLLGINDKGEMWILDTKTNTLLQKKKINEKDKIIRTIELPEHYLYWVKDHLSFIEKESN